MVSTQQLASAFDGVAGFYDDDGRHDEIARRLVATVGALGGVVVDVACGTGAIARAIVGRAESILAIDASPAMIARGRAIGPEAGITWQVGSALPLPVADGSVDVVLCASSLHFLGRAALDDWRRVLKPGGRVGYTLPLRSRFNPSEQFAKLLATDLTLPETVEEAYALAEGFEDVTVTVGTDIVITTARR